jgi:hypothetical protein
LESKKQSVARCFLVQYTKNGENIPNGHLIHQHPSLQGPLEFNQSGIFGSKIHIPSGNPGRNTDKKRREEGRVQSDQIGQIFAH